MENIVYKIVVRVVFFLLSFIFWEYIILNEKDREYVSYIEDELDVNRMEFEFCMGIFNRILR